MQNCGYFRVLTPASAEMLLLLNRGGCLSFCLHSHFESSYAGDCPPGCCKSVLESKIAPSPCPEGTTHLFVGICTPFTKQSRLVSLFLVYHSHLYHQPPLSLMMGFLPGHWKAECRAESWDTARDTSAQWDLPFHILWFVSSAFLKH